MGGSSRHHRRSSKVGAFLRANPVEIIAAVVVALGLFLLLERMNLRSTLFHWATLGAQRTLYVLGYVDNAVSDSIASISLSNALGLVLIVAAGVAIVLRIRWRLIRTASLTTLRCPRCSGSIRRVHRRWGDRVVSWFVPVRRYRCANRECHWCGIRVATSRHDPEPAAARP